MTNIAKRLLTITLDQDNFPRMDSEKVRVSVGQVKEIIAEIEQLRAALRNARCEQDYDVGTCVDEGWCKCAARSALERKS